MKRPIELKPRFIACLALLTCGWTAGCDAHAQTTPPPDPPRAGSSVRGLEDFRGEQGRCFDRSAEPQTFVVDSHLHFKPFGGAAISYAEVLGFMRSNGVLFANMYGIGQTLPAASDCTYYLDCKGTPVVPSIKNDFANAADYIADPPRSVHLTVSMSFPDLAAPGEVLERIELLDQEYPGVFRWMGELNLVKQALFDNGHEPASLAAIEGWGPFMALLRERGIPLAIHADLGHDDAGEGTGERTRFLELFEAVLERYPDNDIVWVHAGLSRELTRMDPVEHVEILEQLLGRYEGLMIDISWSVLYEHYFRHPDIRAHYVALFNAHPTRVLTGTDFVASADKTAADYRREVEQNSDILRDLDDEAFRRIALGQNYFELLGLDYVAPRVCGVEP